MQKTNLTANDKRDQDAMLNLYQARGPMTESDLLAAGISKESQIRNAPKVAEKIRLLDNPMAA